MPFKGLPKCKKCASRGQYSRGWNPIREVGRDRAVISCKKCGASVVTRSVYVFAMFRKKPPLNPQEK